MLKSRAAKSGYPPQPPPSSDEDESLPPADDDDDDDDDIALPDGESTHYTVFHTHNWNKDELGRNNHKRVVQVAKALQARGISGWLDEERMEDDVHSKMCDGIDASKMSLIYITKEYIFKVSGKAKQRDRDYCHFEFNHIFLSGKPMLAIVMEPQCRDPTKWKGKIKGSLGTKLYFDFADTPANDLAFDKKMDELAKRIRDILTSAAAEAAAAAADAATAADAAIAEAAASLAAVDSLDEYISDELRDLLASVKLTKYVPKFIENDLLTLETMLVLSEEELKEDLGLPRASARIIHNAAIMAMQKRQESTSAILVRDSSTVPPPSLTPSSSLGNSSITTPAHVAEIQSEIVESDTSEIDTELLDPRLIRSDEDIKEAVQLWCSDRTAAESRFGDIRYWSTSRVTSMRKLFEKCSDFNDDISQWDVSSVTDMRFMFYNASAFNQDLSGWAVSSVTNMSFMFLLCPTPKEFQPR